MNVVYRYINSIDAERLDKERVAHQLAHGDLRGITEQQILNYIQDSLRIALAPFEGQANDYANRHMISAVAEGKLRDIQMLTGIDFNSNVWFNDNGSIDVASTIQIPRSYIRHNQTLNINSLPQITW